MSRLIGESTGQRARRATGLAAAALIAAGCASANTSAAPSAFQRATGTIQMVGDKVTGLPADKVYDIHHPTSDTEKLLFQDGADKRFPERAVTLTYGVEAGRTVLKSVLLVTNEGTRYGVSEEFGQGGHPYSVSATYETASGKGDTTSTVYTDSTTIPAAFSRVVTGAEGQVDGATVVPAVVPAG